MAKIHASVGMHKNGTKNCYNLPPDVQAIVELLNLVSAAEGAPADPMSPSASPADLYRAIRNFQQKQNDLGRVPRLSVDGHVDPFGPTLARLNQLASRAPAPFLPVMPDMPPSFGPGPEDDPNTVFAGNSFQIKVLEGESGGEVVGGGAGAAINGGLTRPTCCPRSSRRWTMTWQNRCSRRCAAPSTSAIAGTPRRPTPARRSPGSPRPGTAGRSIPAMSTWCPT